MAWRWLASNRGDHSEWTGFLEKGARLEGRLECTGTFRIDSTIKGTLVSDGTLILGKHALVEGEITGNRIVIGGRFSGTIQATTSVEIQTNAIVAAEIHTPSLVIEPGGVFDGQCHMFPAAAPEPAKLVSIAVRSATAHS
jgi:cytoskeletal protein CcmA (bactofilin family)